MVWAGRQSPDADHERIAARAVRTCRVDAAGASMTPMDAKALVAVLALAAFWTAEHLLPATVAGRARAGHDLLNLALGALNVVSGVALAVFVLPQPGRGGGLMGVLGSIGPGATVVALVLFDLWMYAWHRANHAIPFLWRFHRAHHSDTALDSTSAVRFHPGEGALSVLARLPVAWALGMGIEHLVLYESILFPVVVFHHSNVGLPVRLERVLRMLIVTPPIHRVHHSPLRIETDSNFGSVLTVWDRLARSLRAPSHAVPRFGLDQLADRSWHSPVGLLSTPFRWAGGRVG